MKKWPGLIPFILLLGLALAVVGWQLLPGLLYNPVAPSHVICLTHLKGLGLALLAAGEERPDQSLPGENWSDELQKQVQDEAIFHCPSLPPDRWGYSLNAAVAGRRLRSIRKSEKVVLLFESEGGWNSRGGPELLAPPDRHPGGLNFLFCDGHAQWVRREDFGKLIWTP